MRVLHPLIVDTGVLRELATFDAIRRGARRLKRGNEITAVEKRQLVEEALTRKCSLVLASTALAVELRWWIRESHADPRLLWTVVRDLYDEFKIQER